MNDTFTPELLASARTAETPEALLALAAENGITLTSQEAQAHFDQFHQTGELADEELDNVAGGCGGGQKYNACGNPKVSYGDLCDNFYTCKFCGRTENPDHTCRGVQMTSRCCTCKYYDQTTPTTGYCKRPERQKV